MSPFIIKIRILVGRIIFKTFFNYLDIILQQKKFNFFQIMVKINK
jgi:hypothetical protein